MAKKEYVEKNLQWLKDKALEEGVMALPKGIYYKVIKKGNSNGPQPTRRSIITAHYTGWTINGKKFDSSRGGTPLAMRLSDLIDGWIIAIQQMHVGDHWEIYIPARPYLFLPHHCHWLAPFLPFEALLDLPFNFFQMFHFLSSCRSLPQAVLCPLSSVQSLSRV